MGDDEQTLTVEQVGLCLKNKNIQQWYKDAVRACWTVPYGIGEPAEGQPWWHLDKEILAQNPGLTKHIEFRQAHYQK